MNAIKTERRVVADAYSDEIRATLFCTSGNFQTFYQLEVTVTGHETITTTINDLDSAFTAYEGMVELHKLTEILGF